MTVRKVFDQFMLYKEASGLTENSLDSYRWQCLPIIRSLGDRHIEEITQDDVMELVLQIQRRDISKSTKISYIRAFRIFLRWCSMEYQVKYRYEKIKIPRMPKKQIKMYSPEEIQLIFDSIQARPDWVRLRNVALFALFYDSGIRRAEACGLRRCDVDFGRKRVLVTGKGDKQRFAPIGHEVCVLLSDYMTACPYEHDRVFVSITGKALSCSAASQIFHDIQARLPFKLSPHKLRHNFDTNYCLEKYAAGAAVDPLLLQALIGHEDIVTTQRYLHYAASQMAVKDFVSVLDKIKAGQ